MIKRGRKGLAESLELGFLKKIKKGQVWVETVIYTLIALVILGLVLGVAKPKIEELQDNAIIEQSLEMLKTLDSKLLTLGGTGNQRLMDIGIKKGTLEIDGINEIIKFEMDSKSMYSEDNQEVNDGNIKILTLKQGKINKVTLTLDYAIDYDLTFNDEDVSRVLSKSAVAYKILVVDKGKEGGKEKIDFKLI
jgi:hypothetical protein